MLWNASSVCCSAVLGTLKFVSYFRENVSKDRKRLNHSSLSPVLSTLLQTLGRASRVSGETETLNQEPEETSPP